MSWKGNGKHGSALGDYHSLVREKDGVICRFLVYHFTVVVMEDNHSFGFTIDRGGWYPIAHSGP